MEKKEKMRIEKNLGHQLARNQQRKKQLPRRRKRKKRKKKD